MSHGVAARAAAWQRRLRNLPGPLGPQGGTTIPFPQAPLDVVVEIRVDNSWLDITHDVFGGDRSEIDIARGRPNEGGRTQAARCRMQLNNRNGVYSPRNPTSPLYGKIGRNTGIRVKVGADIRFRGEIPAWPQMWDVTGNDVWVDLEAAGILRRLGQRPKPARSALTRRVADVSDDQHIIGHWPFEDGTNASFVASVTPGAFPIAVAAGLRFAADDFLPGSKPVAEVPSGTQMHWHGNVPADPNPSPTGFEVDWFIHMPVSAAAGTRVMVVGSSGTVARWEIWVSTTQLTVIGLNATGGGVVLDTSAPAAFFFAEAGCRYRLRIKDNGGGTVGWQIDVHNVGFTTSASRAGTYAGSPGMATVVANAVVSDVAYGIGHVVVSSADGFTNSLSPADIGYRGETADERVRRLCGEEGVPFRLVGTIGDSTPMGPQGAVPFLDLLRECESVDGGILGESVDRLGLFYRTRRSLYTQQATVALDYTAHQLGSVPTPVDDDERTLNDIILTRPGGSSFRYQETTGPLSVNDPPDGVGVYDESRDLNLFEDDQLAQRAAWEVHLGTVDEPRYPTLHVNLANQAIAAHPDLPAQAAQVRQGDRVTVANLPMWLPPTAIDQHVVGISERLGNFARDIRFHGVPASPYQVGRLDSPAFRLDTAGASLSAAATETATSLTVASTLALWTTAAGDMPFDVTVGDELITVTAVAGASSPQTFTVIRSVNGVVRAHAAGTPVHVAAPLRAAL